MDRLILAGEEARKATSIGDMPELIQINFSRSFPLFPLPGVHLLPHAQMPMRMFEPRYTAMVRDALDGSGQIAMATFQGSAWRTEYHGNPPIRPVVCVGQIEKHESLPRGHYNILLQGICRARIVEESMPTAERPYRTAKLMPLESNPDATEPQLVGWRGRVRELLDSEGLAHLRLQPKIVEFFDNEEIPSHVLVELVGHLLISTQDDAERRYRLLSEADAVERAEYTEKQLKVLESEIRRAAPQKEDWPKGQSWN